MIREWQLLSLSFFRNTYIVDMFRIGFDPRDEVETFVIDYLLSSCYSYSGQSFDQPMYGRAGTDHRRYPFEKEDIWSVQSHVNVLIIVISTSSTFGISSKQTVVDRTVECN